MKGRRNGAKPDSVPFLIKNGFIIIFSRPKGSFLPHPQWVAKHVMILGI